MSASPKQPNPTLDYYSGHADAYAARTQSDRNRYFVDEFTRGLPAGAAILDLGCGAGWAAVEFERRGYDAHAADGCPELVTIASTRLKRPARVMLFDELTENAAYDGIFANAVLHHLPKSAMPGVMKRIARALRPAGRLFASFKQGEGEHSDRLGRFYAYYTQEELQRLVWATPDLAFDRILRQEGLDFANEPQVFLGVLAHRPA
ncbi:MAG: class I SAM-dependent methyltransferase [Pseudomonadota bacterium]|nr:class I SAM-dependent methyltransferase [Pseudomonadota bacterium]